MVEMQFIGDNDEIQMWERDGLWKHNSDGKNGQIPTWNGDTRGKPIYLVATVKFRCGKETTKEMQ